MSREYLKSLALLALLIVVALNAVVAHAEQPLQATDHSNEAEKLTSVINLALDTGGPVELTAQPVHGSQQLGDPEKFSVSLEPSKIISSATWAEVDGERISLPEMTAYEGSVVDRPDWPVRLLVTAEWARGYILGSGSFGTGAFGVGQQEAPLQYLVRINLDGNLPADAGEFGPPPTGLPDLPSLPSSQWPHAECIPLPIPLTLLTDGPKELEPVEARVVLDSDIWLWDALGEHTFPIMVALLQEVDAIYERELGIRFILEGLHMHTQDLIDFQQVVLGYGGENPYFSSLRDYWDNREKIDRDLLHFITGRETSDAVANCLGGAGFPEHAYSLTSIATEGNTVNRHTMFMAHEIGHLFNADHHYANDLEGDRMGAPTIMDSAGAIWPAFSTLSGSAIRGWADQFLGGGEEN